MRCNRVTRGYSKEREPGRDQNGLGSNKAVDHPEDTDERNNRREPSDECGSTFACSCRIASQRQTTPPNQYNPCNAKNDEDDRRHRVGGYLPHCHARTTRQIWRPDAAGRAIGDHVTVTAIVNVNTVLRAEAAALSCISR